MKKTKFESRLDNIRGRANLRLVKRMKHADGMGTLKEYLERIGLAAELEEKYADKEYDAVEVMASAEELLDQRISRARQKGYLKDYLSYVNMLDILLIYRPYLRAV